MKIILLIAILIILLFAISLYFVFFALRRREFNPAVIPKSEKDKTENRMIIKKNAEAFKERVERLPECEICSITSKDGLKLVAEFRKAESHRYAILVHGYKGSRKEMRNLATVYSDWGFNTLLPDNRAHGESGGKWIGMGWLDKDDIIQWINWITDTDKNAEIILHGISMGAATVMMVSGESLPGNVKVIVEDCGYTSVWDIFADELKAIYHIPPFPILYIFSFFSSIIAGYSPRKASSIGMLGKSSVPMLFIHGSDDSFVGTYMLSLCYEAKRNGEKEKLSVKGAGHGESYLVDPELYFSRVKTFLSRFLTSPL